MGVGLCSCHNLGVTSDANNHHMLSLLGFSGLVVGILLWVKCSMVDFIEHLDEVGLLSFLTSTFVDIAYLRIELIFTVIYVCCGLSLSIERFSS
jgi:hypothetical protein